MSIDVIFVRNGCRIFLTAAYGLKTCGGSEYVVIMNFINVCVISALVELLFFASFMEILCTLIFSILTCM